MLYLFPLQTQSVVQRGSPRLRHFGLLLHWGTSFALPGCRTKTVVVTTTTVTRSRLRIPANCLMIKRQQRLANYSTYKIKSSVESRGTHLLSLPSQVEGWVCAVWQSRAWPAVLGSWAERRRPEGHNLSPLHWPPPPYSSLGQRYQQRHTSPFLKTHGQTWKKETGINGPQFTK